jgi:hypothetical protein
MFQNLLIANRGEIACRIIRTARRMGLRSIAVFSDADETAQHVHMADEAIHIGAAPARESYLNIPAIIAAAKRAGADAIHPGYGFLSENPAFAEACAEAGSEETLPGPHLESDDELLDFARRNGSTTYHLIGTARMGPNTDPTAVVDDRLRVHGLEGLRVVDASVMPNMTSANTYATTMMIAEKASDFIRGRPPLEPML